MSKTVQFLAIFPLFIGSISLCQSNTKEDTPLILAVKTEDLKEVKKLLKSGVDVNQLGQDYKTALDVAIEHGHRDIVFKLIKYKAKVTSKDNQQYIKFLCFKKASIRLGIFPLMLIFSFQFFVFFGMGLAFWLAPAPTLWLMMSHPFTYVLMVGFLGACVLSCYTLSLPFQAYAWNSRSKQNWMLPVS